ncbi:MAG TPA: hypothetical protein VIL46_02070, partial [Gemmataceae bacterium]
MREPSDRDPRRGREDLIGYLLGALDPPERRAVESQLAARPELRRELERLRRALEPLEPERDDPAPPPGLAERTLARVGEYAARRPDPFPRGRPGRGRGIGPWQAGDGAASAPVRWRPADALVTAGILATAVGLILPAVASFRHRHEVAQSRELLRESHQILVTAAEAGPLLPADPCADPAARPGLPEPLAVFPEGPPGRPPAVSLVAVLHLPGRAVPAGFGPNGLGADPPDPFLPLLAGEPCG